jgi:hypothetical protein
VVLIVDDVDDVSINIKNRKFRSFKYWRGGLKSRVVLRRDSVLYSVISD